MSNGDLFLRKNVIFNLLHFWNTLLDQIITESGVKEDDLKNVMRIINDYNFLMPLWDLFYEEESEISIPIGQFLSKLESLVMILVEIISDPFSELCEEAINTLGKIGNFKSVNILIELRDKFDNFISDWEQTAPKYRVFTQFTSTGERVYGKSIKVTFDDKKRWDGLKMQIKVAIDQIDSNPMGIPLINALDSPYDEIREIAVDLLESYGDKNAVLPLCQKINDNNVHVRRNVAKTLWYIGDETAVEYLCSALHDSDKFVRNTAANKLILLFKPVGRSPLCRLNSDQKKLILINYDLISAINENNTDLRYNSQYLKTISTIEKDGYQSYRLLILGIVEKIEDDHYVLKSQFHSGKIIRIPCSLYPDVEVGDSLEITLEKYSGVDQQFIEKLKVIRHEIAYSEDNSI